MVAALQTSQPCAHPRCARADEGVCVVRELLTLLEAEARSLGADRVQVTDTGRCVQFGVRFSTGRTDGAYVFRDLAAFRIVEKGLDYMSPSLRKSAAGSVAVTVHLIDKADAIGVGR